MSKITAMISSLCAWLFLCGSALGTPSITGLPAAFSGVISDPTDYASQIGLGFNVTDVSTPDGALNISLSSNNFSVVTNTGLTLQTLGGDNYRLHISPHAVGYATVTIRVIGDDASSDFNLNYAASVAATQPLATIFPLGTSDGSTAQSLNADTLIVGDDENQVLRLYSRTISGPALLGFDVTSRLGLTQVDSDTGLLREVDIEASTRIGNRIYWMGSHGNSRTGSLRPNRYRIFSTDISGSGSTTTLDFVAHYDGLRTQLINWDHNNLHGLGADYFGLSASAAAGVIPETADGSGFNIEGLSFAPGSSQRAFIGFRAPIVPALVRTNALIIPIENFADVGSGSATSPIFGTPIQLNLGGRGIREIQCTIYGCLIVAGPASGSGTFKVYTWSGNPADAPVQTAATLDGLNPEGIVQLSNSPFSEQNWMQLVSDTGDTDYYGDAQAAKNLPNANHKKFRIDWIALDGSSTIPFIFRNGFDIP